jgi:hypothetical protein
MGAPFPGWIEEELDILGGQGGFFLELLVELQYGYRTSGTKTYP